MFFHLKMYRLALDLVSLSPFTTYHTTMSIIHLNCLQRHTSPLPLVKEKQNEIADCTGIRKHFVTQIGYLLDEHVFLVA